MKLSFLFLFVFILSISSQDTVEIPTSYGSVIGLETEISYEFLGIPFAAPPIDSLRFFPPQPWNIPYSPYQQIATSYKPACVQVPYPEFYTFTGEPSEDCLYLNVFTPKSSELDNLNLPVMVWIHGGAFTGGSSTESKYNGTVLAGTKDVIIVTINYRLGIFGFFAEETFCNEDPSCGMWGMLDQQMALQWVQDNINSFGGNPQNVTIFGESAGAMSVSVHMVMESSAGLFQNAIMESGIAEGYPNLFTSKLMGANITNNLGCFYVLDDQQVANCMRSLPSEELLNSQGSYSWWPVINENELSDQPLSYLETGNYNQVPLLIGCNGNEGWLFAIGMYPPPISKAEYEQIVIESFGEYSAIVLQAYPLTSYGNSGFKAIEAIIGDYLFVCPAQFVVQATTNPNTVDKQTFMYLFNHTPSWVTPNVGPYHGAEVNFVYGFRPDGDLYPFTPAEIILSNNMTQWWTNFAKTTNPNSIESVAAWPRYTDTFHQRIVLTVEQPQYISTYKPQECEVWRGYYDLYYGTISEQTYLTRDKLLRQLSKWKA